MGFKKIKFLENSFDKLTTENHNLVLIFLYNTSGTISSFECILSIIFMIYSNNLNYRCSNHKIYTNLHSHDLNFNRFSGAIVVAIRSSPRLG